MRKTIPRKKGNVRIQKTDAKRKHRQKKVFLKKILSKSEGGVENPHVPCRRPPAGREGLAQGALPSGLSKEERGPADGNPAILARRCREGKPGKKRPERLDRQSPVDRVRTDGLPREWNPWSWNHGGPQPQSTAFSWQEQENRKISAWHGHTETMPAPPIITSRREISMMPLRNALTIVRGES